MPELPSTPDFEHWPVACGIAAVETLGNCVRVTWRDGAAAEFDVFMLRENSPDEGTIHPLSREMACLPLEFPDDLAAEEVSTDAIGALVVTWSHGGHVSRYHPGWLRAHGWFEGEDETPGPVLWTGVDLTEPPSFDGTSALEDPQVMLAWLGALRDYGVARLQGLPQEDGLLERVVTSIGPVRESNFGRIYTLEVKDDPDSNAYTSDALPQHIDMPTRETPHGLQFLYCRSNTTAGGEGIYVDGYRIAEDMRREEPEHYSSLTTDTWDYNNRARTTDYRSGGPVVETNDAGQITGVRYNTFLRAPMRAPAKIQARAYRAYRAFCARAQDARYQMAFRYRPGDLLAFDNRRVLHGRAGYDAKGGERFIEGIYADRDDLHSRIRSLQRELRAPRKTAAE